MVVQPQQEATSDVEKIQMESPKVQSMGSVTEGQNKCSPDFQQQQNHAESLGNGINEIENNKEINKARNDTPSLFSPNLIPLRKETNPNITPINSVHQESFLSKLAEIQYFLI